MHVRAPLAPLTPAACSGAAQATGQTGRIRNTVLVITLGTRACGVCGTECWSAPRAWVPVALPSVLRQRWPEVHCELQESEEELTERLRELRGMEAQRKTQRKLTKNELDEQKLFKKQGAPLLATHWDASCALVGVLCACASAPCSHGGTRLRSSMVRGRFSVHVHDGQGVATGMVAATGDLDKSKPQAPASHPSGCTWHVPRHARVSACGRCHVAAIVCLGRDLSLCGFRPTLSLSHRTLYRARCMCYSVHGPTPGVCYQD